jgi:hypothetical protein
MLLVSWQLFTVSEIFPSHYIHFVGFHLDYESYYLQGTIVIPLYVMNCSLSALYFCMNIIP